MKIVVKFYKFFLYSAWHNQWKWTANIPECYMDDFPPPLPHLILTQFLISPLP